MYDSSILGPEPLAATHVVELFNCGIASLNDYLVRRALSDQSASKSRTYVVARGERVIGFFSLAVAAVEPADATMRAAKGQGNQPIPAILLARLAVDLQERGKHIGEALLVEALRKSIAASKIVGARLVLAHALDETTRNFYLKYGFEQSPCHDLHVMILMKDVKKSYGMA